MIVTHDRVRPITSTYTNTTTAFVRHCERNEALLWTRPERLVIELHARVALSTYTNTTTAFVRHCERSEAISPAVKLEARDLVEVRIESEDLTFILQGEGSNDDV